MIVMPRMLSEMAVVVKSAVVLAAVRRPKPTVSQPLASTVLYLTDNDSGLFYFERQYGPAITPREAMSLLRPFGRIDSAHRANASDRAAYNLNEGVVVQFALYDEGQAALQVRYLLLHHGHLTDLFQAFRNHDVYKMQSMANMASPSRNTKSNPAYRDYINTYDIERRSVFVGNLPVDASEAELEQHFANCGNIIRVTIHRPESIIDGEFFPP